MTSASAAHAPQDRLSLPNLVAFATPGMPLGALAIALAVFLPRYYAGHFGLGLAVVGGAFGAVRLIDMMFDPFIGVFMDSTRTRIGRYRPWLLLGAPVLMLAVYMLFIPPVRPTTAYLIGWLFVYYIGASLIMLSHLSWASVIAANYHERSRVFGVIQVVSVVGSAAVLVIPVIMKRAGGAHGGAEPLMGWFVFIVAPLGVILASLRTPEPIVQDRGDEKVTLRDYWEMISRPDMRRIIIADFCLALGPLWMSALYLFYFTSARGFTVSQASLFLMLYIFAGILGAGLVSRVAMKFGKHRTQMGACVLYSLGLISLSVLPSTTLAICAFMVFLGLISNAFILLDRAMIADVGDAIRLERGQRRVGLLYAMITTVQKIAAALSITLTFAILQAVGFDPREGATNTAAAILGLKLVYQIGPAIFVMLGGACYIGYKLDDAAHGKIRAQLDLLDAGAPHAAE